MDEVERFVLAVSESMESKRLHDEKVRVAHQEAEDAVAQKIIAALTDLGGEHGITNAQLGELMATWVGEWASLFTTTPYNLAKRGLIRGTKERRLTKAGKMMMQRVWYPIGEDT